MVFNLIIVVRIKPFYKNAKKEKSSFVFINCLLAVVDTTFKIFSDNNTFVNIE